MEPGHRTALVTGASAGLGAEFARQLAAKGYDLVLVARRADRLEVVARPLRVRHGVKVTCMAADLADREAPENLFRAIEASGLHIDFLVNNAGAAGPNLLDDRDFAEQARFFELMMVSVAHLCHLFVPAMRDRGWGRVVNVASVAGRIPRGGDANYGPAKAYLVALSEALNLELRARGVHICALCPGFTHTEFHATAGLTAMKDRLPGFLWYDADVVVRDGLRAVERGRPIAISGRLYRWADPLMQSVFTRRLFRVPARPTAD
ncbi:MAG: SDR family oxidoreductase [Pseudomonadales bacterium]|jgi:short-subunit dehydrogenase|nr:SDR family oxidoreductase [Pseudomonadales bacterium]